jgi:lipopolysaccharide transport system ATP-binding protein
MYVRLAFAVAAHLDADVLLVDEVLAVGDVSFQRRCLGRMEDVARSGRTVLFVSHNMAAVRALCTRALLLERGRLVLDSDVDSVITAYLAEDAGSEAHVAWPPGEGPETAVLRFCRAWIASGEGAPAPVLDFRRGVTISVEYELRRPLRGLRVGFLLQNVQGVPICGATDVEAWTGPERPAGRYVSRCQIPGYTLNAGRYMVSFGSDLPPHTESLLATGFCLAFDVEDFEGHGPTSHHLPGVLRPRLSWSVDPVGDR